MAHPLDGYLMAKSERRHVIARAVGTTVEYYTGAEDGFDADKDRAVRYSKRPTDLADRVGGQVRLA